MFLFGFVSYFGHSQWDVTMNLALKQYWMPVVFAKVIILHASSTKACTSTSTRQMVREAGRSSLYPFFDAIDTVQPN